MNNKKKYLCRDICKSLVNYKNKWLASCGIHDKEEILNHPTFIKIKQYLIYLNMPKPKYNLQRGDKIPGRDKWKLKHWNYLKDLNLDDHQFLMQIAGKYLNQIHTNTSSTPYSKLTAQQHPEKISSIIDPQSLSSYDQPAMDFPLQLSKTPSTSKIQCIPSITSLSAKSQSLLINSDTIRSSVHSCPSAGDSIGSEVTDINNHSQSFNKSYSSKLISNNEETIDNIIIQSRSLNIASHANEGAKNITKSNEITMETNGIIINEDDGSVSKFISASPIDTTTSTDEGICKTIICCEMKENKANSNHPICGNATANDNNSACSNATTIIANQETNTSIIKHSLSNNESQTNLISHPSTQTPTITYLTEAKSNEKTKQTVHLYYTMDVFDHLLFFVDHLPFFVDHLPFFVDHLPFLLAIYLFC